MKIHLLQLQMLHRIIDIIIKTRAPQTVVCACAHACVHVRLRACVLTKGKDFPEQDAKGPDVTKGRVQVMEDTFWSHPLQGQEGLETEDRERRLTIIMVIKETPTISAVYERMFMQ